MYISLLHPLNAPDHRVCVCLRVCARVAVVDGHQRSLQLISETNYNYNYKQWPSLTVAKASPFKKRENKHVKSSFWFKHNPNDIIQKYRISRSTSQNIYPLRRVSGWWTDADVVPWDWCVLCVRGQFKKYHLQCSKAHWNIVFLSTTTCQVGKKNNYYFQEA